MFAPFLGKKDMCGMIENYDEVINLLNGIITTHLVPRSTVNFFISWKIVNRKVLKQSFHFYCSFDTFYPVFFFFFLFLPFTHGDKRWTLVSI